MSKLGRAEAFAKYGARLHNVQWSVCADAPDGSLVVSLWGHHFSPPRAGKVLCSDRFDRWKGPGNVEFRRKVLSAFQSGQPVRVVISHSEKPDEVDRGADASTLKNSFSVREDWEGRVTRCAGEELEFEFWRR